MSSRSSHRSEATRRATSGRPSAGLFTTYSRNKRSVAADVRDPDGLAFVRRLVARADVLIENFRPGALDAVGLGLRLAERASRPRLVYCSLKGFLSGPYEHRVALDEVVQMMGGLAYMTGPPGQPLRAGASVNDLMGAVFAVAGVVSALYERERTGRGKLVKAGLFENNAFLVAQHMARFAITGEASRPMPVREFGLGGLRRVRDERRRARLRRRRHGHAVAHVLRRLRSGRLWPRWTLLRPTGSVSSRATG